MAELSLKSYQLKILQLLGFEPRTYYNLIKITRRSYSTVKKHLDILIKLSLAETSLIRHIKGARLVHSITSRGITTLKHFKKAYEHWQSTVKESD